MPPKATSENSTPPPASSAARTDADRVLAIFDQLDPADADKSGALADALKYELPDAWFQTFLTLLASGDPKLAPILARAFGYRRLPCGPQLLSAMKRCATTALPEIVWALGRSLTSLPPVPCSSICESEDEPVRSAAALALARMGEPRAIDSCLDQARSNTWPILPLGLAGWAQRTGTAHRTCRTERRREIASPRWDCSAIP